MSKIFQPGEVTLVYEFPSGTNAEQLVSDVVEMGTLIDPDTGDDGKIVRVIAGGQEYDPGHARAAILRYFGDCCESMTQDMLRPSTLTEGYR